MLIANKPHRDHPYQVIIRSTIDNVNIHRLFYHIIFCSVKSVI